MKHPSPLVEYIVSLLDASFLSITSPGYSSKKAPFKKCDTANTPNPNNMNAGIKIQLKRTYERLIKASLQPHGLRF